MNDKTVRNADDNKIWVSKDVDDRLSGRALFVSLVACGAPLLYAGLAIFRMIPVPCDASWPLLAPFFGGGVLAIASLVLSIIARSRHHSPKALVATVISLLAFPATLFSTWLVGMLSLAGHPV